MPDTVFLPDRIEVTRPIPAPPSAIFDIVRSPAGHVAIDALRDAAGLHRRARGEGRRHVRDPHGPRVAQRLPARQVRRDRPHHHVRAGPRDRLEPRARTSASRTSTGTASSPATTASPT